METDEESKIAARKVVQGLSSAQKLGITRACVGLISVPPEPDTLHAVMRLCLRLTRERALAKVFASMGGPRLLLQLTEASAFTGFTSLATLLIRHVLEEGETLRHTMEKI
ncbi:PREDICTED: E3 ubiquitin-protein ligase HUWE1-like [Priapulus caudatus]|uniref:E3 ubiquitin-protein ligase HUWE1-like n=1 Tax=Priapulus caudatus TaxID=37621 RepID=A0ABM1EXS0_PRICU|nr:PREDICTED: E3 ubiquitin-protein ligase HUWE1-like [Priapulus caudatus]